MTGNDLLKRGLPQIATMMVIIITYTVSAFHELLILFGHKVLYCIDNITPKKYIAYEKRENLDMKKRYKLVAVLLHGIKVY